MPLEDFLEGMAYEQIEPFGDRRGDIQAALICQILANIHRSEKRQPYKLSTFLPDWEPQEVKPQSPDDILNLMLMLQAAQNGGTN